jgi:hypothetical protein
VTYANVFRIDRPIHLGDDILDTCDVTNTSQAFRLNFEQIDTTVLRRSSEEFPIGTESEQQREREREMFFEGQRRRLMISYRIQMIAALRSRVLKTSSKSLLSLVNTTKLICPSLNPTAMRFPLPSKEILRISLPMLRLAMRP